MNEIVEFDEKELANNGYDPQWIWQQISHTQTIIPYRKMNPLTPKPANHIRFVCISDTHNVTESLVLPEGDVLLHAGDFTEIGEPLEVQAFVEFLKAQQFAHKIVIAGNHEGSFDRLNYDQIWRRFSDKKYLVEDTMDVLKYAAPNIHYLEDQLIELYGIKIYGTPWQPEFANSAFNLKRGPECRKMWKRIPSGIDILLVHGPPLGRNDESFRKKRVGCYDLLLEIQNRIKPKYCVYGHVHESKQIFHDQ